jgi:hypothetical protein
VNLIEKIRDETAVVAQRHADGMHSQKPGSTALWWTISGYSDILKGCASQIQKHHRRAIRIYGDNAPSLEQALSVTETGGG